MIKNQRSRRNLTGEEISYLRGKEYEFEKRKQGGDRTIKPIIKEYTKLNTDIQKGQNGPAGGFEQKPTV